jgi:hypothetical protein
VPVNDVLIMFTIIYLLQGVDLTRSCVSACEWCSDHVHNNLPASRYRSY